MVRWSFETGRRHELAARAAVLALAVVVLAPASAGAQDTAEVDPLQCWWRTSASAVRIGEVFSVVLTCGVLDVPSATAVVDQSKLDPVAVQLPPFEVLRGTHAPDLHADGRRFFQYEYQLRLISDLLFDKEVPLPDFVITYRVRTRTASGESIQGNEATYKLPAQTIHVLSLVPDEATDIRDAAPTTFAQVDSTAFRSDTLVTAGIALLALGALVGVFGIVRLFSERRGAEPTTRRLLPDVAILRGAGRELSAVRREREAEGWTPALVGRALAALRIVAGYAVAQPATQLIANGHLEGSDGVLLLGRGLWKAERVQVSGSATPQTLAREITRASTNGRTNTARLEELQGLLASFTRARYSGKSSDGDGALDESLASGERLARRLQFEHGWLVRKLALLSRRATSMRPRTWPR